MQWVANKKIGKDVKKFSKNVQNRIFLPKNSQSTKKEIVFASEKYDEIWKNDEIFVICGEKITDDCKSKTARKSELSLLKKYALKNRYIDKNKSPKESQIALISGENKTDIEYVKIKTDKIIKRFRSFFID